MENAGVFFGHSGYFTIIWYFLVILVMLWQFGIFSLVLVYCVKKNLATLELIVSEITWGSLSGAFFQSLQRL
jgi:hypothetical protein